MLDEIHKHLRANVQGKICKARSVLHVSVVKRLVGEIPEKLAIVSLVVSFCRKRRVWYI